MDYKKRSEAGDREQMRFNDIKVYTLGETPDNVFGNEYRVTTAKRSILASYEDAEFDIGGGVIDLLADLRHLCDAVGLNFADHDRVAYGHYSHEKGIGKSLS